MKNKIIIALSLMATTLVGGILIPNAHASSESIETSITFYKNAPEIPTLAVTLEASNTSGYSDQRVDTTLTINNMSNIPVQTYLTNMKVSDQSNWKPSLITNPDYNWGSEQGISKNEVLMGMYNTYDAVAISDGTSFKEYDFINEELTFVKDSNEVSLGYYPEKFKDSIKLFFKTHTYLNQEMQTLTAESTIRIAPHTK